MLRNLLSSIPFYLASLPFTWSHWNTGGPCCSLFSNPVSSVSCYFISLCFQDAFQKPEIESNESAHHESSKMSNCCKRGVYLPHYTLDKLEQVISWWGFGRDRGYQGPKLFNFIVELLSASQLTLPQVAKQRPQDSSQAICLTIGRNTPFFSISSIEALAFRATPKQGFWKPLAASGFLWTIFKYPSSIYPLTSPISILNSSLPISPLLQICDYEDSNT